MCTYLASLFGGKLREEQCGKVSDLSLSFLTLSLTQPLHLFRTFRHLVKEQKNQLSNACLRSRNGGVGTLSSTPLRQWDIVHSNSNKEYKMSWQAVCDRQSMTGVKCAKAQLYFKLTWPSRCTVTASLGSNPTIHKAGRDVRTGGHIQKCLE